MHELFDPVTPQPHTHSHTHLFSYLIINYVLGIISRLPYLKDLGIGAIWLSPFYKSPMVDFGYDVSDYRQVDPLFGTLQDFDDMIDKAHSLGTCKCYIQKYIRCIKKWISHRLKCHCNLIVHYGLREISI